MSSVVAMSKVFVPDNIRTIPGVEDLAKTPLSKFPPEEKAEIMAMAETIKKHGLLQPIVVKDLGKKNGYRLIDGYRRFKAVQYLGGKTIDAKSVKGKTEDEAILKLIANIHRKDLNPLDIARGLEKIMVAKGITEQTTLAKMVGRSKAWVNNYLKLLKSDPAVRKAIKKGEIGIEAARSITALPKRKQAGAIKKAKKGAKAAGKKKVTLSDVRRPSRKRKKSGGDPSPTRPVAEREKEQKTALIEEFLGSEYKNKKVPSGVKKALDGFWNFLFERDRIYIRPE